MPTIISHGSCIRNSPHVMQQLDYRSRKDDRGSWQGYIELLQVDDPTEERYRFIIHLYWGIDHEPIAYYFDSLKTAQEAWNKLFKYRQMEPNEMHVHTREIRSQRGYMDVDVFEQGQCPWFYNGPDRRPE